MENDPSLPAVEETIGDAENCERRMSVAAPGCADSWRWLIALAIEKGDAATMATLLSHPGFPFAMGISEKWVCEMAKSGRLEMLWDCLGAAAAAPRVDGASLVERGLLAAVAQDAKIFGSLARSEAAAPLIEAMLGLGIVGKDAVDAALISAAQMGMADLAKALAPFADCEARGSSLATAKTADQCCGPEDATALSFAAWAGSLETVKALLPTSSPRAIDEWGRTALMFAAKGGHVAVVEELAKAGYCSAREDMGRTALMLACDFSQDDEELATRKKACALILAGLSPAEAEDSDGDGALSLAMHGGDYGFALRLLDLAKAPEKIMSKALSLRSLVLKANPEEPDVQRLVEKFKSSKSWPLEGSAANVLVWHANQNNSAKMFELLIGDGGPFEMVGGVSALELRLEMLRGDQERADESGAERVGIHEAALERWLEKYSGAPSGATAARLLAMAMNAASEGWVRRLVPAAKNMACECDFDCEHGPLIAAARAGRADWIQELLPASSQSIKRLEKGQTALMVAVEKGFVECVEALMAHSPGIGVRSNSGLTALSMALKAGQMECARVLEAGGACGVGWQGGEKRRFLGAMAGLRVEEGADDASERMGCFEMALRHAEGWGDRSDGQTLLMDAAVADNVPIVEFLLQQIPEMAGARNRSGATALMLAARAGAVGSVDLLRKVESAKEQDEHGRTALFYAVWELRVGNEEETSRRWRIIDTLMEESDLDVRDFRNQSIDDVAENQGVFRQKACGMIRARRESADLRRVADAGFQSARAPAQRL